MAYRTYVHQISAGNQFDGTVPPLGGLSVDDRIVFPEQASGGLFENPPSDPGHLMGIALMGAGAAKLDGDSWSISRITSEGDEVVLFSGTTEPEFVTKAEERVLMSTNDKIKVVTSGMTAAMRCYVSTDFDISGGSDG